MKKADVNSNRENAKGKEDSQYQSKNFIYYHGDPGKVHLS